MISLTPANPEEQCRILESFDLCCSADAVNQNHKRNDIQDLTGTRQEQEGDDCSQCEDNENKKFDPDDVESWARTADEIIAHAIEIGLDWNQWIKEGLKYLESYGYNELPKPEPVSYLRLWLNSFYDIMMILLCIAMIVLFAVGDVVAATAILVIVLIATNIGAYTEYTSNRTAAELGDLPGSTLVRSANAPHANSGWVELLNSQLLPGMMIQLKSGDIVPADAIVLKQRSADCFCTEAMLTGESEPVHKYMFHHGISKDDPEGEHKRESMTRLFMGTEFSGDCIALVVETGPRTQMGKIFQSVAEKDGDASSPLQTMIDRLIVVLAVLSIVASALNAAVCIPTGRGIEPDPDDPQALLCVLNSVALTVAAVPENLPVALVIALAAIIRNLALKGVIVKSLPAGEELSRLNYVFSDKTGTLTKNEMTVRAVVTPTQGHVGLTDDFVAPAQSQNAAGGGVGTSGDAAAAAIALANQIRLLAAQAQDEIRSNPTGNACKRAMPEEEQHRLFPFSFHRSCLETATSKTKMARLAITITDGADQQKNQHYLVKVGSDWVLRGAIGQATIATDLGNWNMDTVEEFDRQQCMQTIDTWAKEGYRVISIAVKPVDRLPETIVEEDMGDFADGFVFLGCVVIQDPPREDVTENVDIIRGAGVVVSMITGDNPITGMSIARQIGLASDYTDEDMDMCLINAFELFQGLEEEVAKEEILKRLHYSMTHNKGLIIGRVSPLQKRWFVEVAKSMGLVVAMTGDGANDAPALRGANVGIAMGGGSDIAKAAGDMILVNPSFAGIVEAIRAGRLGFDNILKFLLFLLGTNVSEVIVYLTLTFADIVVVLDAVNLLILNLLTDGFPAIALSLERAEGDLMKRAPLRRDTSVLNKFTYASITITNIALLVSYFVVILLGNLWHLRDIKGADTGEVEDYENGLAKVRMMFILLINISELLLGFSHRCPDRSVFSVGFFSGKWMNMSSLSSMVIIVFLTHTPGLKAIMRTDYVDLESYLLVAAMSVLPFVVHELAKVVIFQRLNFNVYELYKYEYKAKVTLTE